MKGITEETLELVRRARSAESGDVLAKAFTTATGLINYDLERPAKSLYPVLTPLLEMTPRVKSSNGDTATHWRAITAIDTAFANVGTTEGIRNQVLAETLTNYIARYKTLGIENNVTFEADTAAEGFDNAKARAVESLLRSLLIAEENILLGGNNSLALGTGPTPTQVQSDTGGTIAATIDIVTSILPLTHEGLRTGSVAGGVRGQLSRTTADGVIETVKGYSGAIGAADTTTTGGAGPATHSMAATWTAVTGAMAYAVFWGATAGAAQKLGAIVTINSYVITTAAGSGTQAANDANIAGDNSMNALVYDGLLSLALGAGQEDPAAVTSGADITVFATGVAGVGTKLTSDGATGVDQINTTLKRMWDTRRLSPGVMVVNSQEYETINKLVLAATGAPLFRFQMDGTQTSNALSRHITGGTAVGTYFNKFTLDGGMLIKVILHPNIAPGTILLLSTSLPYPTTNVANVWQIKERRSYYQIEWPIKTRKYEYGVYVEEVLQHYAPFSMAVITNIGAGA